MKSISLAIISSIIILLSPLQVSIAAQTYSEEIRSNCSNMIADKKTLLATYNTIIPSMEEHQLLYKEYNDLRKELLEMKINAEKHKENSIVGKVATEKLTAVKQLQQSFNQHQTKIQNEISQLSSASKENLFIVNKNFLITSFICMNDRLNQVKDNPYIVEAFDIFGTQKSINSIKTDIEKTLTREDLKQIYPNIKETTQIFKSVWESVIYDTYKNQINTMVTTLEHIYHTNSDLKNSETLKQIKYYIDILKSYQVRLDNEPSFIIDINNLNILHNQVQDIFNSITLQSQENLSLNENEN